MAGEDRRGARLATLKGFAKPMSFPPPLRADLRFLLLILGSGLLAPQMGAAAAAVDFVKEIAPIFRTHCVRCHNADEPQGGVSLATADDLRDGAYLEAAEGEAPLLQLVRSAEGERPRMPEEGTPLAPRQIEKLQRWLAEGAVWPAGMMVREEAKADGSWWSLQPLAKVTPPAAPAGMPAGIPAASHPIDRFIFAKLAEQGLQPAPEADRRTLLRRLSYDLTGLPPDPESLRRFQQDPSPLAYAHEVDRLLASPHFGERWAQHWLDIAHYADTHGFERDKRRDHAWRYRDYVIRAFNDDKPYDQFLREQLAGDQLAPDDPQAVIATGFLAAGPWDFVGQVETKSPQLRRAARALDLDDMVTQVMTATVAMTVNCARCHDHKLDPISQRDYYRLVAVFAGLQRQSRDIGGTARQEYDAARQQIDARIAHLQIEIGRLDGRSLDLADLVGDGHGFGSGTLGWGLDPRTAKLQQRPFGGLGNVRPGHFAASRHPLIDGVFVPAEGTTPISSTGIEATDLPPNSGQAWDAIRNGPVASQFSTQLGKTDFNATGHSLLGLHANAGVTFDLEAIRKREGDAAEMRFTTVVGYGGKTVAPSAEAHILFDGVSQWRHRLGRHDAVPIDLTIPATVRFLTLISTDGGDGYAHDQISFGDPRLRFPSTRPAAAERAARLAALQQALAAAEAERDRLGEPPQFYGVVAKTPPPVHLLTRGNPEQPGDVVRPGTLSWTGPAKTFGPVEMDEGARRIALAEWITDRDNPLTARVIVNRLWHWHLGRGLVATPSDFGYGGQPPSHPALLDWLAAELIRSDWSLKRIHRLIVTSQTYRMASRVAATPAVLRAKEIDSANRLLWRMHPRRLEAEAIRDAVLVTTDQWNPRMFGPGYRDFDYQEAYAPIYTYKTADSPPLWRRSLYRFIVRTTPQAFLTTLDCPDPANLTPRRHVTTTALQSLALFNNDFMLRQAGYFAERLRREAKTVDDQVDRAFWLAYARPPQPAERQAASAFIEQAGLMHFCRALFNTNEFLYLD